MVRLQGPTGWRFLISEVSLYQERERRQLSNAPAFAALFQSIWYHQFGEARLVFAPKCTGLYRETGVST